MIAVVGGHRLNYSMFMRKEFVWLKPKETFTYLGLEYFIDHDGRLQTSDNFCRMHYQIDNAVKHLRYQQRSLLGRILVLKTMIASRFVYQFSLLPTPLLKQLKKLYKIFYDFIWANKRPKMRRSNMELDITRGGFNMLNVFSTRK